MNEKEREVIAKMADTGRLVQLGWGAFRAATIDADAPDDQLLEMRMAFFAGAAHLWACAVCVIDLEDDGVPSVDDLRRMALIDAELNNFDGELRRLLARRAGAAEQDR